MKIAPKLTAVAVSSLMLFSFVGTQVNAQAYDGKDFDVSITSDKTEYENDEKAIIHIEAKNNSAKEFHDVELRVIIPDGLNIVESNSPVFAESVKSGDTVSVNLTVEKVHTEYSPDEESTNITEESSNDTSNKENTSTNSSDKDESLNSKQSADESSIIKTNNDSPKTGDNPNTSLVWLIVIISFVAVCFLLYKYKKAQKIVTFILCVSVVATPVLLMQNSIQAANEEDFEFYSETLTLQFDGEFFEIETKIDYDYDEADLLSVDEEMTENFINNFFGDNSPSGIVSKDIADNVYPVNSVNVSFVSKNGVGTVSVDDISLTSYMGTIAGAISRPVDINISGDEIEEADITFSYDEEKLNGINEDDLAIGWYDEENNQIVILDNSVVDKTNKTITVHTTHFSKYIVINKSQWYDAWSQEQLVVRNDGNNTPYYNIIFALDNSGSMWGSKLSLCKEATKEFINNLNDKDMVSVVTFSSDSRVVVENQTDITSNKSAIFQKINKIYDGGGTNYEAGLHTALSLIVAAEDNSDEEDIDLGEVIPRQNLIVFISDGDPTDNYSPETLEQLRTFAHTSKTRMVSLGLGSDIVENYLQEMAEAGNGEYFFIENATKISEVYNHVNDWFVGSTKDTDGDGIPDIVETTGMRTQFGEIIKTDPHNPDTDGDSLSDGVEMGQFVYVNDGKSYFTISSNPTIPTSLAAGGEIESSIRVSLIQEPFGTYNTINDLLSSIRKYRVSVDTTVKSGLVTAPDFLSETVYSPVEYHVDISPINTNCNYSDSGKITMGMNKSGTVFNDFVCKNGSLLNCNTDHSVRVKVYITKNGKTKEIKNEVVTVSDEHFEKSIKKFITQENARIVQESNRIEKEIKDGIADYLINPINNEIKTNQEEITKATDSLADSYQNAFSFASFNLNGSQLNALKKDFSKTILEKQLEKMQSDDNTINYKKVASDPKKLVKEIVRCIGNSNNGKIKFNSSGKVYIYDYSATYAGMGKGGLELGRIIDEKTGREVVSAIMVTTYNTKQIENDLKSLCELVQKMIAQTYINCISDFAKDITGSDLNTLKDTMLDSKFKEAIYQAGKKFGGQNGEYSIIYRKLLSAVNTFIKNKTKISVINYEEFSRSDCFDLLKQINNLNNKIESFNKLLDDIEKFYKNKIVKEIVKE